MSRVLLSCISSHFTQQLSLSVIAKIFVDLMEPPHNVGSSGPVGTPQDFHLLNFQFRDLFMRTADPRALEQAIFYGRLAVEKSAKSDPELARRRHDLGLCLGDRFTMFKDETDLKEAIDIGYLALRDLPVNDTDRPAFLNYLCAMIGDRFIAMGDEKDACEAIRFGQLAIDSSPESSDAYPEYLHNLSACYGDLFTRTGNIKHVEEAIRLQQLAVNAMPPNGPDCATAMHDLSVCFRQRYMRTHKQEDLEQAIQLERLVLDSDTPKDCFSQAESLQNLAACLTTRFSITRGLEDLDESIHHTRLALNLGKITTVGKRHSYGQLCISFKERFSKTRDKEDLVQGIKYAEDALALASNESQMIYLYNASMCHYELAKVSTPVDPGMVDEAISLGKRALETGRENHPYLVECLRLLGLCFLTRAEISGSPADVDECVDYSIQSLRLASGLPLTRMRTGVLAATCLAMLTKWTDSATVFEESFDLLPLIFPRTSDKQDLQHMLKRLAGAVPLAASVFLKAGKSPAEALQILEKGRGIIDSLTIDSKFDVPKLKNQHKDLYARYINLREVVALPVEASVSGSSGRDASVRYALESLRRSNAATDLDTVIQEIRQKPGFEAFLQSQTNEEILRIAAHGPVVIFNVSKISAEAFLITTTRVDCVFLPELKDMGLEPDVWLLSPRGVIERKPLTVDALGRRDGKVIEEDDDDQEIKLNPTSESPFERIGDLQAETLFIWEHAVKPVLDKLNLLAEKRDLEFPLPRVWWIGAGLMTKVPFHAAGNHSPGSTENTMSHVVSSYATTLKSLQYARRKMARPITAPQHHRLLIVSMAETPGFREVLNTEEEIAVIEEAARMATTNTKVLRQPNKADVLREFPDCTICHFACHAKADAEEPGKSALFLGKSELEKLSIADLNTIEHPYAQIAYLSACSTAEVKIRDLLDENIHLASTFLMVGFPHVIGTLWKADDSAAVQLAGDFYKCLLTESDGNEESVAFALHRAVLKLRASKTEVGQLGKWVPFVHLGA